MQMACRDRNRIGLQADLVGAALHGIENVCCMTGDDVTAGDEPEARRVFDLDSPQLIATAAGAPRRPLPLRPRDSTRRPTSSSAASRTRARRPTRTASSGRSRRSAPARSSSSSRSASSPSGSRASWPRPRASASSRRRRSSRRSCSCARPRRCASSTRRCPGSPCPPALIERCESAPDPEEACFQVGLALAQHALSQPGVAGLHLISFRREAGIARLCRELEIPTRAEREASGYRSAVAI